MCEKVSHLLGLFVTTVTEDALSLASRQLVARSILG